MTDVAQSGRRHIAAPQPASAVTVPPQNQVVSVALDEEEDVEWIWSTTPSGASYVSGYNIIRRTQPADWRHD